MWTHPRWFWVVVKDTRVILFLLWRKKPLSVISFLALQLYVKKVCSTHDPLNTLGHYFTCTFSSFSINWKPSFFKVQICMDWSWKMCVVFSHSHTMATICIKSIMGSTVFHYGKLEYQKHEGLKQTWWSVHLKMNIQIHTTCHSWWHVYPLFNTSLWLRMLASYLFCTDC